MLCLLVTLFSISFSGDPYKHYAMVLIPLIAYPLSGIFGQINAIKINEVRSVLSMLVVLYLLIALILPDWEDSVQNLTYAYDSKNRGKISMTAGTVAEYVENNTTEDDCISVYGNWDIIYVLSNRKHATRYSYQYPIGDVRPEIMEEYFSQLAEVQPPVIVVQAEHFDNMIDNFLSENNYKLEWAESKNILNSALVYAK